MQGLQLGHKTKQTPEPRMRLTCLSRSSPAFHPAVLLMATDESFGRNEGKSLDQTGFGGDALCMEEKLTQPEMDGMRNVSVTQHQSNENLRDGSVTLDAMPSYVSTGARMDYACATALRINREISSESALAVAAGCALGSLRAMRKETYSSPRSADGVNVMRRIALLSKLSFDWIRYGESKTPVALTDEEQASVRAALGLESATPAGVSANTANHTGHTPFSKMALMKLWGMVSIHPRTRAAGWSPDDIFACVLELYSESNGGRASITFIDQFIQQFNASLQAFGAPSGAEQGLDLTGMEFAQETQPLSGGLVDSLDAVTGYDQRHGLTPERRHIKKKA